MCEHVWTSSLQHIHLSNVCYIHATESESYYQIDFMNIPDAVSVSVVRMTDSVPSVRVSIALMHTVTTPSVSLTVYMTGSNPTRITAINHSEYYTHTTP